MMDDRGKVAEELRVPPALIDMYSFPQVFASTAGPFGGIGGQAMTSMQIDAYTDGGCKRPTLYPKTALN